MLLQICFVLRVANSTSLAAEKPRRDCSENIDQGYRADWYHFERMYESLRAMSSLRHKRPFIIALTVMGGKWKPLILYHLHHGTRRFGDLKRLVSGISEKVLTQQLRDLQAAGLLIRHDHEEMPPRVNYTVTPFGVTLVEVADAAVPLGHAEPLCNHTFARCELAQGIIISTPGLGSIKRGAITELQNMPFVLAAWVGMT